MQQILISLWVAIRAVLITGMIAGRVAIIIVFLAANITRLVAQNEVQSTDDARIASVFVLYQKEKAYTFM